MNFFTRTAMQTGRPDLAQEAAYRQLINGNMLKEAICANSPENVIKQVIAWAETHPKVTVDQLEHLSNQIGRIAHRKG